MGWTLDGTLQDVLSVENVVGDADLISSDSSMSIVGDPVAKTIDLKVVGLASAPDASTTVKGVTKLSVAPASATNPIAYGQNDPAVVTLTGTQTLTNKTLTSPAISTPTGIVKGDVGLGNVDNTSDATKNAATATLTNKTLTSPVVNTPTGIVKGDVGLGNVDNTSDATKNSATATLTNKTIDVPTVSGQMTLSSVTTPQIKSSGDAPLGFETNVVDGASANGFLFDAVANLATTGNRHTRWRNNAGTTIMSLEGGSVLRDLTYLRGNVKIGDGITNTNYVNISSGGTLTLVGTARKVRTTTGPHMGAVTLTGGALAATVGFTRVIQFPVSLDSGVYVAFPKPEDFDTTVDPSAQVYFSASTSFAGNFAVRVTARVKANNGDLTDAGADIVTDDVLSPSATANQQKLTGIAIVGGGVLMIIRSVMYMHIQRLGLTNPGGVDTHTGSMQLHTANMSYTCNGFGA